MVQQWRAFSAVSTGISDVEVADAVDVSMVKSKAIASAAVAAFVFPGSFPASRKVTPKEE